MFVAARVAYNLGPQPAIIVTASARYMTHILKPGTASIRCITSDSLPYRLSRPVFGCWRVAWEVGAWNMSERLEDTLNLNSYDPEPSRLTGGGER